MDIRTIIYILYIYCSCSNPAAGFIKTLSYRMCTPCLRRSQRHSMKEPLKGDINIRQWGRSTSRFNATNANKRYFSLHRPLPSHKPVRYISRQLHRGSAPFRKSRRRTDKSSKRTVSRKVHTKKNLKRKHLGHLRKNIRQLKLVLLYTLGVLKKRAKNYERIVGRKNLRSGVKKYLRLRDRITRVAKLLNDMEWKDTTTGRATEDSDKGRESFFMSPDKFNQLLTSLGTGKIGPAGELLPGSQILPNAMKMKEEKHDQAMNNVLRRGGDNGVSVGAGRNSSSGAGDNDYDFLTSQSSEESNRIVGWGEPNGDGVRKVLNHPQKTHNETDSTTEDKQVAEILHTLQEDLNKETQALEEKAKSKGKEATYLSPTKFNSLLESLGSDQWPADSSSNKSLNSTANTFETDVTEYLNSNDRSAEHLTNKSASQPMNTNNPAKNDNSSSELLSSALSSLADKVPSTNSSNSNAVSADSRTSSNTFTDTTAASNSTGTGNQSSPTSKTNKGNITYVITNTIARFASLLDSLGSDDWAWNLTDSSTDAASHHTNNSNGFNSSNMTQSDNTNRTSNNSFINADIDDTKNNSMRSKNTTNPVNNELNNGTNNITMYSEKIEGNRNGSRYKEDEAKASLKNSTIVSNLLNMTDKMIQNDNSSTKNKEVISNSSTKISNSTTDASDNSTHVGSSTSTISTNSTQGRTTESVTIKTTTGSVTLLSNSTSTISDIIALLNASFPDLHNNKSIGNLSNGATGSLNGITGSLNGTTGNRNATSGTFGNLNGRTGNLNGTTRTTESFNDNTTMKFSSQLQSTLALNVPDDIGNRTSLGDGQLLKNESKRINVEGDLKDFKDSKGSKDSGNEIASVLATLSNPESVLGDNADDVDRNSDSDKKKYSGSSQSNQGELSIILKYERLLKLLHSKVTAKEAWKQNTFLNISVSKFEKMLDALTTEFIAEDEAKAKEDRKKEKAWEDNKKEKENHDNKLLKLEGEGGKETKNIEKTESEKENNEDRKTEQDNKIKETKERNTRGEDDSGDYKLDDLPVFNGKPMKTQSADKGNSKKVHETRKLSISDIFRNLSHNDGGTATAGRNAIEDGLYGNLGMDDSNDNSNEGNNYESKASNHDNRNNNNNNNENHESKDHQANYGNSKNHNEESMSNTNHESSKKQENTSMFNVDIENDNNNNHNENKNNDHNRSDNQNKSEENADENKNTEYEHIKSNHEQNNNHEHKTNDHKYSKNHDENNNNNQEDEEAERNSRLTSSLASSPSSSEDPFEGDSKVDYVSQLVQNTQKFHKGTMAKFKKLLQLISFRNLIRNLPHMRVDQGPSKHVDYYTFNDTFINKVDNLMKMLAFNRIFDDMSQTNRKHDVAGEKPKEKPTEKSASIDKVKVVVKIGDGKESVNEKPDTKFVEKTNKKSVDTEKHTIDIISDYLADGDNDSGNDWHWKIV